MIASGPITCIHLMVLAIQRKASARLKVFYFLQALQPKSVKIILLGFKAEVTKLGILTLMCAVVGWLYVSLLFQRTCKRFRTKNFKFANRLDILRENFLSIQNLARQTYISFR